MRTSTPFCAFLVDSWRTRLFRKEIFPGFPFVPPDWIALAFNRDNHGDVRLPDETWQKLIVEILKRTREQVALIVSPEPLIAGTVAELEQPFVVPLNGPSMLAHFADTSRYLPEFFMAGASERWAIWGDSDLTVVGGEREMMSAIIDNIGGVPAALVMMTNDFALCESPDDSDMHLYLRALLDLLPGEPGSTHVSD